MAYRFTDLVDIEAFRAMLQALYDATGIHHGLVDSDNVLLSAAGWQDACTAFHRTRPCTSARCLESDRALVRQLGSAPYVGGRCLNGLMDYATAIVVEGRQLATLYFGQCLHEPPDLEWFRAQARECGFDEEAYLAAIRKVPLVPRERVAAIMAFYVQLAQMLAHAGLDRLRQREAEARLAEANRDLAERVAARTHELSDTNDDLRAEIDERRKVEEALRTSQGTLRAILDASPVAIGWSRAGDVEYVNARFTELFGYARDDVPTLERWLASGWPDEVYRDAIVRPLLARSDELRPEGKAGFVELPLACKDGSSRQVIMGISWAGDRRVATFMDVTDRWLADQREKARRVSLEMIAEDAPLERTLRTIVRGMQAEEADLLCAVLVPDLDGVPVRIDASPVGSGEDLDGEGRAAGSEAAATAAGAFEHHPWCAAREEPGAGSPSCWSEPVLASDGRALGTLAICHRHAHGVTERERSIVANAANLAAIAIERHRARLELERQAKVDFLTGIPNRRCLIEIAETELARAHRYARPASVLMVDIDHFKAVNDEHGHVAGDLVLQGVAATLRASIRTIDTVGRLGGEEFAVVLPEADAAGAFEVAERLRAAVAAAETPTPAGAPVSVTISVGVATLGEGVAALDALLSQADRALYQAKRSGRNRVCALATVAAPPARAAAPAMRAAARH